MAKDNAGFQSGGRQTKTPPGGIASLERKLDVEISPPQTAEDFVLRAIEEENFDEVVKILRDWYGLKEIKNSLNRLPHRDPTNRILHIHRRAVEMYAKEHGLTPANLMVKLRGIDGRSDPEGSERHKLKRAREYLEQYRTAHIGAAALARYWKETRPKGRDAIKHLKGISPEI